MIRIQKDLTMARMSRSAAGEILYGRRRWTVVGASLYEPINAYKPVATSVEIVDGPFE
jgi:hypothetical protein